MIGGEIDLKKLFDNKKGLIMGVANDRSLVWGIAKVLKDQGADLAFSYQPGPLEERVRKLANSVDSTFIAPCDGASDSSIRNFFRDLKQHWERFDFVVNGMAFAEKEELKGRYLDTSRKGFLKAMDVSCYSFTHIMKYVVDFMSHGGSALALTYHGSTKVMPHYNVMGVAKAALEASIRYLAVDLGHCGIRVNAISAGPVRTLASSGISDFRYILDWCRYNSPLQQNVSLEQVGMSAAYLLSEMASGVTGEIHYVDSGYNIIGMKNPSAPDIQVVEGEKYNDAKYDQ